jgi:hypothetical protein
MYIKCHQTGFWSGHRRTDFITSADICKGYKYNYHFYDVLRLPRIDHLQPTRSFKIAIHSPRTNQNQPGEVWWYLGHINYKTALGVFICCQAFNGFNDNLFKFKQRSVVTNTILLLLEKSEILAISSRIKLTTQSRC